MSNSTQSVPYTEVELSSDGEEIVSTINNEISTTEHLEDPSTPDTQCSICFSDLTNKCCSNSCKHFFCFECLKRWSYNKSSCPLCKKLFTHIYHTFTEQGVHETYVPVQGISPIFSGALRTSFTPQYEFFGQRFTSLIRGISLRLENDYLHDNNSGIPFFYPNEDNSIPAVNRRITGLASRVQKYILKQWAVPLPNMNGDYRGCSSAYFRNNVAEIFRLCGFIHRDIMAIREILRTDRRTNTILESAHVSIANVIMRSVTTYEIREPFMVKILQPFLNEHATHFCHELFNFANSLYDMDDYDRLVQYCSENSHYANLPPTTQNPNEFRSAPDIERLLSMRRPVSPPEPYLYLSDSDIDSIGALAENRFKALKIDTTEMIEVNSENEMDQPSTSTGIRDPLNQPNNSTVKYVTRMASGVGRGTPNLDSSSDKEESTNASQIQAHIKS